MGWRWAGVVPRVCMNEALFFHLSSSRLLPFSFSQLYSLSFFLTFFTFFTFFVPFCYCAIAVDPGSFFSLRLCLSFAFVYSRFHTFFTSAFSSFRQTSPDLLDETRFHRLGLVFD
ncbi:hypothetical protein BJ508DRAFT_35003 [Ascobolus immersus RN42]|uniref:Transmembrane protein n=1 Tax=Ascobolus immersus RN42 TaxID=1160509 RepID=A0A3N4HKV6_ASCIM|nr:hypothetical protein BJ508DRAFT_35003 [Ascobolus immersus RN42]